MNPIAFMRELVAKGMSWEDAAAIAEKFEERVEQRVAEELAALMPKRSKAAERQAAYRERKRNGEHNAEHNGVDNAVTLACDGDSRPLPSSPQTPQQPTPTREENTTSREKRGSRIPEGFNPDLAVAEALGLTLTEAAAEADKFLDYWRAVPGAKGRKLDWPATWRNWCRSASERKPTPRKAHERPHSDDKFDRRQANLARAFAASERVAGQRWEP